MKNNDKEDKYGEKGNNKKKKMLRRTNEKINSKKIK